MNYSVTTSNKLHNQLILYAIHDKDIASLSLYDKQVIN